MVGATLAISDFMLMLLTSAFWVGGGARYDRRDRLCRATMVAGAVALWPDGR
jgi:hypothetical protein